ncbi:MAG TPA: heterodisulfide reductase-related iron-sulfur binding cluster [Chloroflexota bacterium]|nr:heterodisulfide reductase-related iron-sulfur binding cluster [Chloroflexota bacterium]
MAVTEPEIQSPHGVTVAESPGLKGFLQPIDYEALVKCVHCGLCLNECPTYRVNGLEPDSPRGRLYLIRAVSEGTLPVTDDVVEHLQRCLVCRSCETACPSNVQFGQVMEAARHSLLQDHSRPRRRFLSWLAFRQLFPYPNRLKLVATLLRLYQHSPLPALTALLARLKLMPSRLAVMEKMSPPLSGRFFEIPQTERVPAVGERRYTVGMIAGCIMPLAFADTNAATARVLAANGCDVILPMAQRCCGALAAHSGDAGVSNDLARTNIDAFERFGMDRLDSIVINAAGCGAQLKNYGHMLAGDPRYAQRAQRFAEKVEDVSEFLARVGLTAPLGPVDRRVTYQDACHLIHGQKIKQQPRDLLKAIPGLELIEMRDAHRCCGSAGIYNITNPDMSMDVLDAKMENVLATGTDCVVAGNPGCLLQLNLGLKQHGKPPNATHLIDLLDESIRRGGPGGSPTGRAEGSEHQSAS